MNKLERIKQREKRYRNRKGGVLTGVGAKIRDKVEDVVIDYAKDKAVEKTKDLWNLLFGWIKKILRIR